MYNASVVPYKPKRDMAGPAIDSNNDIVPPLDYSFCRLTKPTDVYDETPRMNSPRKVKTQKAESGKSNSRCLRLNNNALTEIDSLIEVASTLFEKPSDIAWLDLSFNELTAINPAITELKNLQILYLHGNQISSLAEIEKLKSLTNLRKLTLHGNAVENEENYRYYVLSILPNLQELDFSCVTRNDRRTAETWRKMGHAKKKKNKAVEN
ncbi:leucine-rich repeat-containing protein 51-like [Liolophura sinensis]|uniref:leucine-rich repeat-containing protein 51-like n=1 Tax=Liolophura sinensis TaxID=3198878 RepID=UPI0031580CF6